MKRILLALLIIPAIFAFAQKGKNNLNLRAETIGLPKISNFKARNYLGHPHSYDAVQDNRGIMYFANLWGIIQFDGVEWKRIPLANGATCTSLARDSNGTIYIGSRNDIGYLKEDSIGSRHFVSIRKNIPGKLSFNEVWKTISTKEGILFFSHEVLLLKPNASDEIKIIGRNIQDIYDVDGEIILLNKNHLYTYKDNRLNIIEGPEVTTAINSIISLNTQLICATDIGLFIYDKNSFRPWATQVNNNFRSRFSTIKKTNDNRLVITIKRAGLAITDLEGNILTHINKQSGLLDQSLTSCYIDRNNDLWLTSNSGISFIPLSDETALLNDYLGITGTAYSSAIYNGYLYLSTSDGLFRKPLISDYLNRKKDFERIEGISGVVWNLYVFDNKLFCGQANSASTLEGDKLEQIYNRGTWLFQPLEGGSTILIGTYNGLALLEKKNNQWQFRNSITGFNESSRYLTRDKYGDIWVSHGNKGVYQIRLNNNLTSVTKLKYFNKSNGLPENYDNNVFRVGDKIIISAKKGIFFYDHELERIKEYFPLEKVLGKDVHLERLVQSSPSTLLALYDQGILAKIKIVSKDNYKLLSVSKRLNQNTVESFEHINPISDKFVIAGTQEGFTFFKFNSSENTNPNYFPCYISKLATITPITETIWNGYSAGEKKIEQNLSYSQRSIKFSFAAPYYKDLQNLRYQFYLEGFDTSGHWSEWTPNPYKEYTNLKEGNYRFYVRAMNSEGTLSKVSVMEVRISAPWYRTWLAYFLYLLIAVFLFKQFRKYFKERIEKEKKKIELDKERKLWQQQREWDEANLKQEKLLVKLQQEKLEAEALNLTQKEMMIEITKEKDREVFEMQQEKLQADLSSKNNELTSLTIHITQKNEVLTRIKNSINKAIKDTKEDGTKVSLSQIEQLIEKNLNSQKEWEKFSEHFDIVHEDFLKKLQKKYPDLKASSLKLCAYVKMKLSSKQIAVLMNTEPESVIKARYRLRLKFGLHKDTSLEEFLNNNQFD